MNYEAQNKKVVDNMDIPSLIWLMVGGVIMPCLMAMLSLLWSRKPLMVQVIDPNKEPMDITKHKNKRERMKHAKFEHL